MENEITLLLMNTGPSMRYLIERYRVDPLAANFRFENVYPFVFVLSRNLDPTATNALGASALIISSY